jgi:hypothetical protein
MVTNYMQLPTLLVPNCLQLGHNLRVSRPLITWNWPSLDSDHTRLVTLRFNGHASHNESIIAGNY